MTLASSHESTPSWMCIPHFTQFGSNPSSIAWNLSTSLSNVTTTACTVPMDWFGVRVRSDLGLYHIYRQRIVEESARIPNPTNSKTKLSIGIGNNIHQHVAIMMPDGHAEY
mmetsp:Transcript_22417/g.27402  ORF Transcript_22417/g.27402 Transcript_22417/m.27402 type:complete len:111 (+) Transcript_22417:25-357(+)